MYTSLKLTLSLNTRQAEGSAVSSVVERFGNGCRLYQTPDPTDHHCLINVSGPRGKSSHPSYKLMVIGS